MNAPDSPVMTELEFEGGTVVVRGLPEGLSGRLRECRQDPRIGGHRMPASAYRELVLMLHRGGAEYRDLARAYEQLALTESSGRSPRDYQLDALAAWRASGRAGVVVLPTGTGKTYLGMLAIADAARSALVVTPTLDLVAQWADQLAQAFDRPIGVIGGGSHTLEALTVITYASAQRRMAELGNRFGLVIFDECHHLPGPTTQFAARAALAPFRLGLTATPERDDGKHVVLDHLIGPRVYQRGIDELAGQVLAPYQVVTLEVDLTDDERERYETARAVYLGFIERSGIRLGGRRGWDDFVRVASRDAEGRAALAAHREQRQITRQASAKLTALAELLAAHPGERTIVFTADNRTVYEISRRFLLPALTHQTKMAERRELLAAFGEGRLPILVTSQVLNEGVDVPDAAVGVVLSGSGSVREHVQRLGRILRPRVGKRAVMYEILTRETSERYTSERRREHPAYRRGAGR